MERLYRNLLISLFIIHGVWLFAPWNFAYGAEGASALEWLGYGSLFSNSMNVLISDLVGLMYFLAYIGMFFYNAYARSMYLFLIIVVGLLSPFLGIGVQSGWEAMLLHFLGMGDGFLIAIAYFTSVSKKFQSKSEQMQSVP